METAETTALATELERTIEEKYGVLLNDEQLCALLAYRSMDAFRQSVNRKTLPVPVFSIPNRKGKFALTRDVARWLAEQRNAAAQSSADESTKQINA